MIYSQSFDLRILFKKFYCPVCGQRLRVTHEVYKLTEQEKKRYYKELYPHGIPIPLDVGRVTQMFKCDKCNYYNTTDNQLLIRKKQKKSKKSIIDNDQIKDLLLTKKYNLDDE